MKLTRMWVILPAFIKRVAGTSGERLNSHGQLEADAFEHDDDIASPSPNERLAPTRS